MYADADRSGQARRLGLLGWAVWSVALVWSWRLVRRMKARPSLLAPLNDEFVRHARLRAFAMGFWAMLITQALVLVAGDRFSLPASLGAQLARVLGAPVEALFQLAA